MLMTMETRYRQHYGPLIGAFCRDLEGKELPGLDRMPQPFLPIYGQAYFDSSSRIVIVGQDTKGWGNARAFVETGLRNPDDLISADFEEFREHAFTAWGGSRYTFWGFAMMFLAAAHGHTDWQVMKAGGYEDILSSFAWGNGNAVELFNSTPKGKGVPYETWETVYRAGNRFNGITHLLEVLDPHVVVVTWKAMDPREYFAGQEYDVVDSNDPILTHYTLRGCNTRVFHVPHPGRMKFEAGADVYCASLVNQLRKCGIAVEYPKFVEMTADSNRVVEHLMRNAPEGRDNFAFVEWVAGELHKRGSVMSVQALADLLNVRGHRTNDDDEYAGGRGTYRLVRGTYHRLNRSEKTKEAEMVACAFVKPDGNYAFPID